MAPVPDLAELFYQAVSRFVDRFTEGRVKIRVEPRRQAPNPQRPLTRDEIEANVREWIWTHGGVHQHFPGGRNQFEYACSVGYVRWHFDAAGLHVDVGPPPPGAQSPPPRTGGDEAPSRRRPTPSYDELARAMRTLGYKKTDMPQPLEIKDRYRDLARRHHPDHFINQPHKAKVATERMQRINQAYELLKAGGVAA